MARSLSTIINKDKRLKPPPFDILSPGISYTLLASAFLLLGAGGTTPLSLALFFIFIASFLAGARLSRPGESVRYPLVWRLGLPLIIIGAAAEFANIAYAGSLPLAVPSARARLIPALSYLSFLIVPGCLITMTDSLLNGRAREALFWVLSGTFLVSLLGYRTEVFALLIGASISAYYVKGGAVSRLSAVKLGAAFLAMLVALNLFFFSFRDSPLSSSLDRFSVTMQVFSSLAGNEGVSLFGVSGGIIHASVLSSLRIIPGPSTGPRTYISQLVGVSSGSTTPTILGIPYLDFGLAGIIALGAMLGFLFGSGYKMIRRGDVDVLPVHALCMAFLFITLETGIADAIVLVYLIAYLLIIV